MKKIIKNRGEGKTTDLIKISAEKQIPIIAMSNLHAVEIMKKAAEMGLNIPTPTTCKASGGHIYCPYGEVLVDEIDYVLQNILGCKINTLTITNPKKISKSKAEEKCIAEDDSNFEIVDIEPLNYSIERFLTEIVYEWNKLPPDLIRSIEKLLPSECVAKLYELRAESLKS